MLVNLIGKVSDDGSRRRLLVLSDRRLHCQTLQKQFGDERSGLYMGGMKEEALRDSSTRAIIFATFSQAHEGLDIPALDTVILATPKSDIQQSIGRVMRETPGKHNSPRIYDIHDHWSLLNSMAAKRKNVYKKGGFKISGDFFCENEEKNPFRGKCLI